MSDTDDRIQQAIANPKNLGEMADADAVGTVGSPECGDMLRMWIKFAEKDGRKVIDKASFQSFGCQTAIAVASVATEMIAGKTVEEALEMSAEELADPLGPLPPMKIHCGQLVENALRDALEEPRSEACPPGEQAQAEPSGQAPALMDSLSAAEGSPGKKKKIRIVRI